MFSDSQLYRLKYQHHTIAELVHGFTQEQLRIAVNPGKWTVQQNIAHLAAYQEIFLARLDRIQNENEPLVERYVGDNDPVFLAAEKIDISTLLAGIEKKRAIILNTLSSFNEAALHRTGIHPRLGKMDVTRWAEFFLLHEAHHLFTIFMLTADLRTSLHLQIS